MKPDISEFSYGYAVTECLIWDTTLPVVGAPIFPSLIAEGRSGGYDVAIPISGLIVFLQFKLSHFMKRNTALEAQHGCLSTPFYRMHLRPKRHSMQHEMLLDLEVSGHQIVFYAAPKFHLPQELNRAYLRRSIIQQSIFIKPSIIGPLPDTGDHHISFKNGFPVYMCSEPKVIRDEEYEETSLKELAGLAQVAEKHEVNMHLLDQISKLMFDIILRNLIRWSPFNADELQQLRDMHPVEKIQFFSRAYFGCEPLIVKARKKVQG
jgi:hypothetical protein